MAKKKTKLSCSTTNCCFSVEFTQISSVIELLQDNGNVEFPLLSSKFIELALKI